MGLAVCFPQQRLGTLVSKDKVLGASRLLYCQVSVTGENNKGLREDIIIYILGCYLNICQRRYGMTRVFRVNSRNNS